METRRDHSPSQERHRRRRDENERHERRHGEGRGNNSHSRPSSPADSQQQQRQQEQREERRSERSRRDHGSSSPSSRRHHHPRDDDNESRSSVSSSPEISRLQLQPIQQQEQDQHRRNPSDQEQHQTFSDQTETTGPAQEEEPASEKPLDESKQQMEVQSSGAGATSESTAKPHLLSSSLSTLNPLDRHKSKRDSQEQHQQIEAKEDAKIEELKATIRDLERQEQEIMQALRAEGSPEGIIDRRIKLLHEYNEIKDVGQLILGKCAEIEGTTIKKQYENYGLDIDD